MKWKMILLDEPTSKFLGTLKSTRQNAGMHQWQVAEAVKVKEKTYQKFELGVKVPSLENLMTLARFFGYDLSESLNHKVFYGKIKPYYIKQKLRRYDLSYSELSKRTGYTIDRISYSVRMTPKGSLMCLSAVLEVIREEQLMEAFREKHCLSGEGRIKSCVKRAGVSGKF